MADIQMLINVEEFDNRVKEIERAAVRLPSDVNGNPRYYVSCVSFCRNGEFYRPGNASVYRGKKYGRGWVFQTYNLKETIRIALELEYGICRETMPRDNRTPEQKMVKEIRDLLTKAYTNSYKNPKFQSFIEGIDKQIFESGFC